MGCHATNVENDRELQSSARRDILAPDLGFHQVQQEYAVSRDKSDNFDPFVARAQQSAKEGRAAARRKNLRRLLYLVVFAALVVVLMHALGGSDQPAAWAEVGRELSSVRKGEDGLAATERLLNAARRVEPKRGNMSALEGMYAVASLEYLLDDKPSKAAAVIQLLRAEFQSGWLFGEHWDERNLTEGCGDCSLSDGRQVLTCAACGGSGKASGLTSGMKGPHNTAR